MNRFLKTLVLWLMVMALPTQGYAAVTMSACGTIHRHGAVATLSAAVTPGVEKFNPVSVPTHAHQHQVDHQHSVASTSSHADTMQGNSLDQSNAQTDVSCSTCQSCCAGMGMIAFGLNWQPSMDSAMLPPAFVIVSFTGFIPSGLERPPRTLLV